ncbi:conserved unknown protein [Ectocarpus siliculosus]|uniref:Uncharacterized protein n=1 Tax=Ectocarpus siliculosus TaxID=2880 RepID=D7FTS2_ECTSI|nr:conserved unknown protein [Ectocarpus siliculosus]|eukprot:CBJ31449.1 conserved unknown protein [Ectocarpus siliculosus]
MNPHRTAQVGEGNVKHRGGTAMLSSPKLKMFAAGDHHAAAAGTSIAEDSIRHQSSSNCTGRRGQRQAPWRDSGTTSTTPGSGVRQQKLTVTASRKQRLTTTLTVYKKANNTTTPCGKQTGQSAWAMKPTERGQPFLKAAGRRAPTTKVPPRVKPAAAGTDGGIAKEIRRSPRKKRRPPRVSASRHMAWERELRAPTTAGGESRKPSSTNDTAVRRGRRKARKSGGGGGEEDGRPSLGTWQKASMRLEILKKITGKDDEELEWLITAQEGQGVKRSERRRENAETEYHRLLFEESMLKAGREIIKDRRLEVSLKTVIKMGEELQRLTKIHEQLTEQEKSLTTLIGDDDDKTDTATEMDHLGKARGMAEAELRYALEGISAGKERVRALGDLMKEECGRRGKMFGESKTALETVIGITASVGSARELVVPARARSGLDSIEASAKTMSEGLSQTSPRSSRKETLPEYVKHLSDEEAAWFEREADANDQALRSMRSLMPVGVTGLTVAQLEQAAIDGGSLFPRELSLRLKENRLLQWVVMHPEDIARSNFLQGAHAHFFTNMDKYDLVEMRAILACLPAKFEVDDDGRKAAWRAEFVQRAKGLVAQERGDTVSRGWDPEISARRQVRLPELSAGQTRREEYFYPTAVEVQARVDKLRERQCRLEAKRAELAEVRDKLLPEARQEHADVLEDTRHPFNKKTWKPEDLRRAREEAKSEVNRLSKEEKRLEGHVVSAARALRDSPSTVDGTLEEAAATRRLLSDRNEDEGEAEVAKGSEVEGAFDPTPELRSRRSDKSRSLRFVTADEEAKIRKEELARVFSSRGMPAAAAAAAVGASEDGGGKSTTGAGDGTGVDVDGEEAAAGEKASVDGGSGPGHANGRIKAFGAVLEKTLSKTLHGRAPPPGTTAAAAAAAAPSAAAGAGSRKASMPVTASPPQRAIGEKAAGIAAATLWKPKSKFFRVFLSANTARKDGGDGSHSTGGLPPPPPPPPAPMLGMLSQIRARGEVGGGGGGGTQSGGSQAQAGIGGLLAEIRARGDRGGGGGGGGGTQSGGGQGPAGMGDLLAEIRAAKRG